MDSKPKISMKDMCAFLGVSPTTIRLYEQYLHDRRYDVSETGYRKFDSSSLVQLYDMRFFSKCGVSLLNSAEACQSTSRKEKVDVLTQGEQELLARRNYYASALQQLNEAKTLIFKIKKLRNSFEYIERPGFWYLECEEDGRLLSDAEDATLIKSWVDALPITHFTYAVYSTPEQKEWTYRTGLAIYDRHAKHVPISHERVRYIPPQTCLATTVADENSESTRSNDFSFASKVLSKSLRFMKQEGLKPKGDIFSRFVVSNMLLDSSDAKDSPISDWYYVSFPVA